MTGLGMNLVLRTALFLISIRELYRAQDLLKMEPIETIEVNIVDKLRKKVRKDMKKEQILSVIIEEQAPLIDRQISNDPKVLK